MPKLYLENLTCMRPAGGGSTDQTYMKIRVDERVYDRWPESGHRNMRRRDNVFLGKTITFDHSVRLQLFEYDSGSADDFMGEVTITAATRGNTVRIIGRDEGSEYELSFAVLPGKQKWLRFDSARCVIAATGIDGAALTAVTDAAADASRAAARVIGEGKTIGKALEAAGGVFKAVPAIAKAIDEAGQYPDQLYITRGGSRGVDGRVWPLGSREYVEVSSGQVVRFQRDLRFLLRDPVDLSFWEYDSLTSDDLLGTLIVEIDKPIGWHVDTVTSEAEGAAYLVAYEIGVGEW